MAYDEPTLPGGRDDRHRRRARPGSGGPAAPAVGVPFGRGVAVPPTYSLTGAAIAIQVLLAAQGIVAVSTIVDIATSLPGATGSDSLAAIRSALFVVTGAVWIGWLTAARLNVRAWDAPFQRRWWGWTVLAWFLPVIGLFAPAMITRDIADATDARPGSVLALRRPQWLVLAWGLAYAVLVLLLGFASLEQQADGLRSYEAHPSTWTMAAAAMTLLAIVPAVALVRSLTRRQRARMVRRPGSL